MEWHADIDLGLGPETTLEADSLDEAWMQAAKWAMRTLYEILFPGRITIKYHNPKGGA